MANKDLYEENKRLKAEVARMQDDARKEHDAEKAAFEELFKLSVESLTLFLKGTAHLRIEAQDGAYHVYFRI